MCDVDLVLCYFMICDFCNHHHSQDTQQFHHHKDFYKEMLQYTSTTEQEMQNQRNDCQPINTSFSAWIGT